MELLRRELGYSYLLDSGTVADHRGLLLILRSFKHIRMLPQCGHCPLAPSVVSNYGPLWTNPPTSTVVVCGVFDCARVVTRVRARESADFTRALVLVITPMDA